MEKRRFLIQWIHFNSKTQFELKLLSKNIYFFPHLSPLEMLFSEALMRKYTAEHTSNIGSRRLFFFFLAQIKQYVRAPNLQVLQAYLYHKIQHMVLYHISVYPIS